MKKGPYGCPICGSSNAYAESPNGARHGFFCLKLPQSHYYISRVERKTMVTQTYFLKPLFRGNLDPFVNNANLGAIAHTSNGT